MTIQDIRDFLKVVELGKISAAADERYVSRQGMRSAISSMEKELGAPLLKRTSKGVIPTEFGRYFAELAQKIDIEFSRLPNAYEDYLIKTNKTIRISLPVISLPWNRLARELGETFEKQYPEYHVEFDLRDSDAEMDSILQEDGEFVMIQSVGVIPECEHIELLPTEYYICISNDSDLAKKQYITRENIKKMRFVTRSRDTYIYKWLTNLGIPESQIIFDSSNFDVKRQMIKPDL